MAESEEPADTGGPDHEHSEPALGSAAQVDAAWADIIAHYGARADVPEAPAEPAPAIPRPVDDSDRWQLVEPTEHYVPPVPPPAPRPQGVRGAAWIGLFGTPALMLVLLIAGITVPMLLGVAMFVAFVGSLTYLIVTMPRDRNPWDGPDDGAVV